jgi:hypothetical protein
MADGSQYDGPDFTADFHTYGLDWTADHVTWYVDGEERFTHTGDGVPQVEMYVIANLAIGGGWPGAPDGTTVFPANLEIDYVRAYQPDASGGASSDAGGASSTASGGANGTATGGATSVSSGGASSGGSPAGTGGTGVVATGGTTAGGTTNGADPGSSTDDGGCGCRLVPQNRASVSWALLLTAVATLAKRRARHVRNASA